MIDAGMIAHGKIAVLGGGESGKIVGCYMSATGIVVNVKVGDGIVERNVPLADIVEVKDGNALNEVKDAAV